MKDKNGNILKHGDYIHVDSFSLNVPILSCTCRVCGDKFEIIKGKEPDRYCK